MSSERDEPSRAEILVADDDPDIRSIVAVVLEAGGYAVRQAADGSEAAHELQRKLPDLAIFDLSMPGHTGMELCDILRAIPQGDVVPIVILTARDGSEARVAAFDGGADEYVTKPFNHRELLARVRSLLRVRALHLSLLEKNRELHTLQQKLLQQERSAAISQMAGSAAHNLGQPLAAIMLNAALIEQLPSGDERSRMAIAAIRSDAKRMAELLKRLSATEGEKVSSYFRGTTIVDIEP